MLKTRILTVAILLSPLLLLNAVEAKISLGSPHPTYASQHGIAKPVPATQYRKYSSTIRRPTRSTWSASGSRRHWHRSTRRAR